MLPIQSLAITKFKRFENFDLKFSKPLTVISGPNGTGKSSLLHLISNTFQRPAESHGANAAQRKILSDMPGILNVKIEKLARGDRDTNDPTRGTRGTIYQANGRSFSGLDFRRHQTRHADERIRRYYLKPYYAHRGEGGLPPGAVVYLGLSRLLPQGEFDDARSKISSHAMDQESIEHFSRNYKNLTLLEIDLRKAENLDGLKYRLEFGTKMEGIDSNTISAGQDNVAVILSALEHLAALSRAGDPIDSILLIDEFDATLHPDLQIRLMSLFIEYSKKYSIQIVLTTQSMEVIEYAHKAKSDLNLIYLVRKGERVTIHPDPSPHVIRMLLHAKTRDELGGYESQTVHVFSEDAEARLFLRQILTFCTRIVPDFNRAVGGINIVDINLGSDQLKSLFKAETARDVFSGSVCVLDGDAGSPKGMSEKYLVTCLPGGQRPESVLYDHARSMVQANADQFADLEWLNRGFTTEKVERVIHDLEVRLEERGADGRSGSEREIFKSEFNKNTVLFEFVALAWCRDERNHRMLVDFMTDFGRVYGRALRARGGELTDWSGLIGRLETALGEASS